MGKKANIDKEDIGRRRGHAISPPHTTPPPPPPPLHSPPKTPQSREQTGEPMRKQPEPLIWSDPPEAKLSSNRELPEQSRALPALASLDPCPYTKQYMHSAVHNQRRTFGNSSQAKLYFPTSPYASFLFLLQPSNIIYYSRSHIPISLIFSLLWSQHLCNVLIEKGTIIISVVRNKNSRLVAMKGRKR